MHPKRRGSQAKTPGWKTHGWKRISWTNSRHKKKIYRGWREGQIAWEEYREIVWTARDQVGKLKPWCLARDGRSKKDRLHRYVGDKRKTRENGGPLEENRRQASEEGWGALTFFSQSSPSSAPSSLPKSQKAKAENVRWTAQGRRSLDSRSSNEPEGAKNSKFLRELANDIAKPSYLWSQASPRKFPLTGTGAT